MRTVRLLPVLVVLLVGAAVPSAAQAGTLFGAGAGASPTASACLNGDTRCTTFLTAAPGTARAPSAGVLTRVSILSDSAATYRLRTLRAAGGGSFTAIAGSQSITTIAFPTFPTTVSVRVPVQQDDYIGLDRPSDAKVFTTRAGSGHADLGGPGEAADGETRGGIADPTPDRELMVSAVVEPDADGDGYGDHTQDGCLGDPARNADSCSGTLVGPSLSTLIRDTTGSCAATCLLRSPAARAGVVRTAPADGVIVRWRVGEPEPAETPALDVLRPGAGGALQVVSSTPRGGTAPGPFEHQTVPSRIPIRAGDELALRTNAAYGAGQTGGTFAIVTDPPAPGGSFTPSGSFFSDAAAMVNADVEADADLDGFGDETQDLCPIDATRQTPCRADLAVTLSGPASLVAGTPAGLTATVRNLGPSPAPAARLALVPTGPLAVTGGQVAGGAACGATTCALDTLAPGAERTVQLTVRATTAGAVRLDAEAASDVADPDAGNSGASFTGTATAAPTGPGGPAVADTVGPRLTLGLRATRLDRRRRASLTVTCPRAETTGCRTVTVELRASLGRRTVRVGRVVLGGRLAGGARRTVRVVVSKAAATRLRRTGRLVTTVRAGATDAAGNRRTTTGRLTVRPRR